MLYSILYLNKSVFDVKPLKVMAELQIEARGESGVLFGIKCFSGSSVLMANVLRVEVICGGDFQKVFVLTLLERKSSCFVV